jgi:hypothetical protein
MRRRARWTDIPEDCRALVHHLVAQRLLLLDEDRTADGQGVFVEVTHEAVLRHWPLLGVWLEEEASDLGLLDNIRSATVDWLNNELSMDWLVHAGRRLASARSLFVKPLYAASLSKDTSDYLTACERNLKTDDRAEYDRRASLLKAELGEDIFEKLDRLQGMYDHVKTSRVVSIHAFVGGLVDELQQRKNRICRSRCGIPPKLSTLAMPERAATMPRSGSFPAAGRLMLRTINPARTARMAASPNRSRADEFAETGLIKSDRRQAIRPFRRNGQSSPEPSSRSCPSPMTALRPAVQQVSLSDGAGHRQNSQFS